MIIISTLAQMKSQVLSSEGGPVAFSAISETGTPLGGLRCAEWGDLHTGGEGGPLRPAATSPGQGRSWGERFLDRGGVGGEKKKGGEEDNEQKNSYIGTIIH